MKLTRAAADLALAAWTAPSQPETTKTPAETAPAQPAPQPEPPQPAPCPIADPALTFARLTRAVRQAMALEARLAADEAAGTRFGPRPPPDPRRTVLRQALHHATATHPDRAELRCETDERLDHELALDTESTIPEILATICEDLGIPLDYQTLPDELLGLTPPSLHPEPVLAIAPFLSPAAAPPRPT